MNHKKTIRALRDPEYRNTLNNAASLNHPAGMQELEDNVLASVTGGCGNQPGCTGGPGGGGPIQTNPRISCGPGPCW